MRIINTSVKNIKNFFNGSWMNAIITVLFLLSVAITLFIAGALFEQYRMSMVYPLSISYEKESGHVWDRYIQHRIKGKYVASRNGTKFYPSTCASAQRIKRENKIYFTNKQHARSLGFEETKRC